MYRILIQKPSTPCGCYTFYTKKTSYIDETTGEAKTVTCIYETDNLDDLAEEYSKLLKKYNTENIVPIQKLAVTFDIEISERQCGHSTDTRCCIRSGN